jgi:hypothetical protein
MDVGLSAYGRTPPVIDPSAESVAITSRDVTLSRDSFRGRYDVGRGKISLEAENLGGGNDVAVRGMRSKSVKYLASGRLRMSAFDRTEIV